MFIYIDNIKFDKKRYLRNIFLQEIGEQGQEKLFASKVLVVGLGGGGSNIVAQLASLGIGTLGLIDFDDVELSNLNRQFIHKYSNIGISKVESAMSWVKDYNPDINVKGYKLRLDESNWRDIVSEYDFIVDCCDNPKTKFLINKISLETNKPVVTGGCYAYGGFIFTIIPNKGACLGCIRSDNDINRLAPPAEERGIISPTVAIVSSIMAKEIFKLVLGLGTPLSSHGLSYDGLSMKFQKIKCDKKIHCTYCSG